MAEHLQQAAIFSKSRESTLNISDTVRMNGLLNYCNHTCMHLHADPFSVQNYFFQLHGIHDISHKQTPKF